MVSEIGSYLQPEIKFSRGNGFPEFPIKSKTEALQANAYYFNNPEWAEEYLTYCHRSESFKSRWSSVVGDLSDKVVVDIGCGPGNIFATLQQKPKVLFGVDVAAVSLNLAEKIGYTPILADATDLPFKSEIADVVMLNATLHHCDDMATVLKEAARIVKLGGILVTDHDPQLSAWNYKGPAKLMWNSRLIIYKLMKRGFHKNGSQQDWALKSEVHHRPGHGVTEEFFMNILRPMGFDVKVYPHNHGAGTGVLKGNMGKAELKYRLGNVLSGRNPSARTSALSLMCLAKRNSSKLED